MAVKFHKWQKGSLQHIYAIVLLRFVIPTETDPDLGYPSTSTNRWMMSMASHEVEYSTKEREAAG